MSTLQEGSYVRSVSDAVIAEYRDGRFVSSLQEGRYVRSVNECRHDSRV